MSNTFCVMPFTHLNIKHEGKVSACWRYPDKLGNYHNETLAEIWNNSNTKLLRKELLTGTKSIGCRSCWDLEESNSNSTRQQCEQTYDYINQGIVEQNLDNDYDFNIKNLKSIEIRFDNICNLMCRFCSPDYSSVWENAVKNDTILLQSMIKYGTYRKSNKHLFLTNEIIEEITTKLAPNLNEILIAGGEALYHEKHYDFLQNLQPYAKNIRLSYNSNLTTLKYKGKNVTKLWKNFKSIWLRVSLDATPKIYNYVRTGGNINKVINNVDYLNKELKNLDMSGTCTTCIYNITKIVEIIKFFTEINLYFHTSLVQYPKALNIKLLPLELKEKITKDFNNFVNNDAENFIKKNSKLDVNKQLNRIKKFGNNVLNYMNSENLEHDWNLFLDYTKVLDAHHSTNYLDYYPEFKRYS